MPEIGFASMPVTPTFKGLQNDLERGSAKALTAAGKSGGDKFGDAAAKEGGETFSNKVGGFIKSKAFAVAGGAAGLAFGGAVVSALDNEALSDKLAAQLGAGPKFAKRLGKTTGDLYAGAFGDSMESVSGSLRAVVQNLDGFRGASKSKLEDITGSVLNLTAAFDEEPQAFTRAASQLVRNGLAKNAKKALDVITVGFQSGADKSEDLLDTFNEYGTQFRKLGLNGRKATGLLSQGLKAGARDSDTVADALKEFAIRAVDGSKLTRGSFKALGLDAKDMSEKIAGGGPSAAKALDTVLDSLRGIEDPAKRSQVAVGLFGTKAEDMGDALFALDLDHLPSKFDKVAGATDRMGDMLNDNAKTKITEFTRTLKTKVVNFLGNEVIPAIEDFAEGPTGKKLGKFFSDAADKVGPLAKKALPKLADALEDVRDFAKDAEPYAKGIVDAFNGMPGWVKQVLVAGAVGGAAAKKFNVFSLLGSTKGSGLGGGSGLLGLISKAKPIPVFVTNPGGIGGGLPGGGGKIPPIVPGAVSLPKLTPLIPLGLGGAPGQDSPLKKILGFDLGNSGDRWEGEIVGAREFNGKLTAQQKLWADNKAKANDYFTLIRNNKKSDLFVTVTGWDIANAKAREQLELILQVRDAINEGKLDRAGGSGSTPGSGIQPNLDPMPHGGKRGGTTPRISQFNTTNNVYVADLRDAERRRLTQQQQQSLGGFGGPT